MDKRAIKSKNSIIATFLALIKTKPIERLTVKELCEKAQINKSTFYAHYHDLSDLNDQLETDLVNEILASFPKEETYSLDCPEVFVVNLYRAFLKYEPQIHLLFPKGKEEQLGSKLEKAVKEYVWKKYPQLHQDIRSDILITYQIQGAYYTFLNTKENEEIVLEVIAQISHALHALY